MMWRAALLLVLAAAPLAAAEQGHGEELEARLLQRLEADLAPLEGLCAELKGTGWWRYQWCHRRSVRQQHVEKSGVVSTDWSAGEFVDGSARLLPHGGHHASSWPMALTYEYRDGTLCEEVRRGRQSQVMLQCCGAKKLLRGSVAVQSVKEVGTCRYMVVVCAEVMCRTKKLKKELLGGATPVPVGADEDAYDDGEEQVEEGGRGELGEEEDGKWTIRRDRNEEDEDEDEAAEYAAPLLEVGPEEREQLADQVRAAFYHGYHAYMTHAFPHDELKPLTCAGEDFELTAGDMLSLVDALDMLVVLGDYEEFARGVEIVQERLNFARDTTVSVFETTIRVLGGLLSAHLFASDPELGAMPGYQGGLLPLIVDLADRLMPAFDTATGIPFGTVNLMYGVPEGETREACTAAAGSLSLEFGLVSVLTGDARYGVAARGALEAIFKHRSTLGLVGRHIDVMTGRWTEPMAGIGSNIDSLYEYYLKQYVLFGDDEAFDMFRELYEAAVTHLRVEQTWYVEVNMHRGNVQRRQFNNLQAFWPGMQTLVGDLEAATKTINAFMEVWNDFGFTPEDFGIDKWAPLSGGTRRGYPLRPELGESVYYMSVATEDPTWLVAGRDMLASFEKTCRVGCGYASVKDIKTERLHDSMPSFFLSETLKYLFLLFDESNPLREDRGANYVFTTEAHPLPVRSDFQRAARRMGFARRSRTQPRAARAATTGSGGVLGGGTKLWGVPSLGREMTLERQCPALFLDTWMLREDPYVETYYAADPELRRPRRSGFTATAPPVARGIGDPVGGSSSPRAQTAAGGGGGAAAAAGGADIDDDGESDDGDTVELPGQLADGTTVLLTSRDRGAVLEHPRSGIKVLVASLDAGVTGVSFYMPRPGAARREQWNVYANMARPLRGVRCRVSVWETEASGALGAAGSCPAPALTLAADPVETGQSHAGSLIDMPCSISAFGPDAFDGLRVQAPLVASATEQGCTSKGYPRDVVEGAVTVVRRGGCMFEQKAKMAETAGALATVVVQTDPGPSLFYMVGMSDSEWFARLGLAAKVPAFMLAKDQGDAVAHFVRDRSLQIEAVVDVLKAGFPRAFHTKDGKLIVLPCAEWGVEMRQLPADDGAGRWVVRLLLPADEGLI